MYYCKEHVRSEIYASDLIDVPMMVSTTSKTTTTWVLAVLAYTTVTGGDVSAVLASL